MTKLYKMVAQDVFGIESNVVVFITKPLNYHDLLMNWQTIRNEIAERQLTINDEFERWNHYLFYLAEEDAYNDITLKYKIEHDTISSRKIVISAKEYSDKDDVFKEVEKRYIKYSFEDAKLMEMDEFIKNTEVVELIEERMI